MTKGRLTNTHVVALIWIHLLGSTRNNTTTSWQNGRHQKVSYYYHKMPAPSDRRGMHANTTYTPKRQRQPIRSSLMSRLYILPLTKKCTTRCNSGPRNTKCSWLYWPAGMELSFPPPLSLVFFSFAQSSACCIRPREKGVIATLEDVHGMHCDCNIAWIAEVEDSKGEAQGTPHHVSLCLTRSLPCSLWLWLSSSQASDPVWLFSCRQARHLRDKWMPWSCAPQNRDCPRAFFLPPFLCFLAKAKPASGATAVLRESDMHQTKPTAQNFVLLGM